MTCPTTWVGLGSVGPSYFVQVRLPGPVGPQLWGASMAAAEEAGTPDFLDQQPVWITSLRRSLPPRRLILHRIPAKDQPTTRSDEQHIIIIFTLAFVLASLDYCIVCLLLEKFVASSVAVFLQCFYADVLRHDEARELRN